jgi:pyruvate formate lyase activating enzyme
LKEYCKYLDAANVDLKGFKETTYNELNSGSLEPVLDTLKILKRQGKWFEITNLIVPSWTDDMDMIKEMARWLYKNGFEDYPIHFSKFSPMYKLTHLTSTPISKLEEARQIALEAGIKYVYIGNVAGHKAQSTFCPSCGKVVIGREGYAITENNMVEGRCKFCKEKIAGVWA